jgi:hypothetical protein
MGRWKALRLGATAGLVAVVFLMAIRWGPRSAVPATRADVTVVYVGAEDCAPCRAWQYAEGKRFLGSAEFARLNYREVKSPTARDALEDRYWPEDLRAYRDRLGRGAGVPLWLVISGDEVIERGFGASQWHAAVWPRIKSLLR